MHYDVHYYSAKFEIKIQLVYGETKNTNFIMPSYSLGGYSDFGYTLREKIEFFPKKNLAIFHCKFQIIQNNLLANFNAKQLECTHDE